MRLFPKTETRKKGWPRKATHIYNGSCGCRMFCNLTDESAIPMRRVFLVHCARDNAPAHQHSTYTEIVNPK